MSGSPPAWRITSAELAALTQVPATRRVEHFTRRIFVDSEMSSGPEGFGTLDL
jgi:hypothetical protein